MKKLILAAVAMLLLLVLTLMLMWWEREKRKELDQARVQFEEALESLGVEVGSILRLHLNPLKKHRIQVYLNPVCCFLLPFVYRLQNVIKDTIRDFKLSRRRRVK